jgi:hypothetical protein
VAALQRRFELGREEPRSKKTMTDLINELVDGSWQVWEKSYREAGLSSREQLLLHLASEAQVQNVEKRAEMSLPLDCNKFLRVTNGILAARWNAHDNLGRTDDIVYLQDTALLAIEGCLGVVGLGGYSVAIDFEHVCNQLSNGKNLAGV